MGMLSAGAPFLPQIVGGIGALKSKTPKAPSPIPMPDPEMIKRARLTAAPKGTGRASTILTGTDDGLGG